MTNEERSTFNVQLSVCDPAQDHQLTGSASFPPNLFFVKKLAIRHAVFMDQARELDVVTAVFRDLGKPSLLEPANGLKALGSFLDAHRGLRNRIQ